MALPGNTQGLGACCRPHWLPWSSFEGVEAVVFSTVAAHSADRMADPDGAAVCEYNIYNLLGVIVAAPSTYTMGKGGTTPWRYEVRPPAGETLQRFEGLSG